MNTAIRLSKVTWDRTVDLFQVFAQIGVEGGCLWYGRSGLGIVESIGVPSQTNRTRNFAIESDSLANLNMSMPNDLVVIAQLHAHPGRRVYQSRWDDRMVVSRKILSIVMPNYGRAPVDLDACGMHRVVDGRWRCLDTVQRAESLIWMDTPAATITDLR